MAKRFVDPNKTCGENHLRDVAKMVCLVAINFAKPRR
nr:MAG TPA: type VI secretion protein [Caudoviricetes sp.]